MKPMRALVALALPVLLAACAYTHLQKPELSVVGLDVVKGDLFQQQLRVRMRVHNPNDVKLPVRSISYEVELAGKAFAHGESKGDFVIPPNGDTQFDVNVTANVAAAVLHLLSSGQDRPQYRISGKVQLASGLLRSIPFDHTGELKLH